jgi:hypothetical protein
VPSYIYVVPDTRCLEARSQNYYYLYAPDQPHIPVIQEMATPDRAEAGGAAASVASVASGGPLLDVIRSIPLQGLQSPFNNHAFRAVSVFLPAACMMCNANMYVWTEVVACLKCSKYCHRSCMRSTSVLCERLRGVSRQTSRPHSPRGSISSSLSDSPRTFQQHPGRCIWRYELKKLATSTNLFYKSKSVALNIDSVDDMLSSRYTPDPLFDVSDIPIIEPATSPSMLTGKSVNGVEIMVEGILQDRSSFACVVLHHFLPKLFPILDSYKTFPAITAILPNNNQYDELLRHARQCLDAISLAVIASLPMDADETMDSIFLTAVVNICDNYVLFKYCYDSRFLYDELMAICEKACSYIDEKLLVAMTRLTMLDAPDRSSPTIESLLDKICGRITGLNKLKCVVALLHHLTTEEVTSPVAGGDNLEHVEEHYKEEVGADHLLDLVTRALCSHLRLQEATVEAALCSEVSARPCSWNAHCMFMSFMTAEIPTYTTARQSEYDKYIEGSSIHNDGGWTLGAEGYALATLQTALYSLYSS